MAKYSDADIARLSRQDYKSLTSYEQRLVRGHNRGLSRSESRGHARTTKGETPISQRQAPRLQKGTGRVAPPTPAQKPTLSNRGKSGKRNLGRHVTKQYNQQGEVRRTRVNARTTSSLERQVSKTGDSQGLVFHLISKDGTVVKAVSDGKNHTANAGEFKRRVADRMAMGDSWDDAFWEAIDDSFDLYDQDGNPVAIASLSFTNIIMYTE